MTKWLNRLGAVCLLTGLGLSHAQGAENLVLTKIWLWKNEAQLQLESQDRLSGYVYNFKIRKHRIEEPKVYVYGGPAIALPDYCHMKDMILAGLLEENLTEGPPEILLYGPREEIFPDIIDFRKRLHEYSLPRPEVNLTRSRQLFKELFEMRHPCSSIPVN